MYLEYDGLFAKIRRRYFRKVIARLRSLGATKLLDYGCGPGDVVELSNAMELPCVGIDSSQRSVALAESRGLKVLLGDAASPELDSVGYDAVFLQSVIEHIPNAPEVLSSLIERLPDGGILVLSAPTPCSEFWNDPTHVRPYTPRSFRVLGELLGLEVLEVNYVFSYLIGLRLESPLWYKALNLVPASLGSNLIGVFRKPRHNANRPTP